MDEICPLVFQPIFREKIWGGRQLEAILNKPLPAGALVGESWECADLESAQSVVARGPASGRTLHELIDAWGTDLIGHVRLVDRRFPILVKFLDATQNLSVQVHPDEATAARLGAAAPIKHEAWHILQAAPGAGIYRGLRPGVSVDDVRDAMRHRPAGVLDCLQHIPVRAGQTYFLPSGTPHAIGAGIVAAEIQTPSDVTYRLYDWDRTRAGADAGLHVEAALDCIQTDVNFSQYEKRSHATSLFATITRLVQCPGFSLELVRFIGDLEQEIPYVEPVVWVVLSGSGEILFGADGVFPFGRGDVVVVPAGLKNGRVRMLTDCAWLEVTLPIDVAPVAPLPRAERATRPSQSGQTVPLNISIRRPG